jgi:hypothetical protein
MAPPWLSFLSPICESVLHNKIWTKWQMSYSLPWTSYHLSTLQFCMFSFIATNNAKHGGGVNFWDQNDTNII